MLPHRENPLLETGLALGCHWHVPDKAKPEQRGVAFSAGPVRCSSSVVRQSGSGVSVPVSECQGVGLGKRCLRPGGPEQSGMMVVPGCPASGPMGSDQSRRGGHGGWVLRPVTTVCGKAKRCPECSGWSLNAFDPYLEILPVGVI